MPRPRWCRVRRTLLLCGVVLALILPVGPASAAPSATAAKLTKKGDIGPDGLPIPPGGVVVGNEVFYNNGQVALRFDLARAAKLQGRPAPALPGANSSSVHNGILVYNACSFTTGWYCFFQNSGFGGRRLRFQDSGYFQYLSDYGFENQTTSWVNNRNQDVRVWDNNTGLLWCSDSHSASLNVGTTRNDKADYFYLQTTDGYC